LVRSALEATTGGVGVGVCDTLALGSFLQDDESINRHKKPIITEIF